MAYLLEFPPSKLPEDILAPPYVMFGIQGESVAEMLPPRIPLNAVLHFIPKLAQFVLPAPENLPLKVVQGALRTPRIGLDIRLDIGVASLQRIILKMLQSAGRFMSKRAFRFPPSTITSLSIRKTWLLFELPHAGLDGLFIHLQSHLMAGPPVSLEQMKAIWDAFPPESAMLRAMVVNFIQSHLIFHYSRAEFSAIQEWYVSDDTRRTLFTSIQEKFPAFDVREAADKDRETLVAQKAAEDHAASMKAMEKMVKDSQKQKRKPVKKQKKSSVEDLGPTSTIPRSFVRKISVSEHRTRSLTMEEMTTQLSDALRKVKVERENEAGDAVVKESKEMTIQLSTAVRKVKVRRKSKSGDVLAKESEELTTQLSDVSRTVKLWRENKYGDDLVKESEETLLPTIYDPNQAATG